MTRGTLGPAIVNRGNAQFDQNPKTNLWKKVDGFPRTDKNHKTENSNNERISFTVAAYMAYIKLTCRKLSSRS